MSRDGLEARGTGWRGTLLRLLVGAGLLAFLGYRVELGQVADRLRSLAPEPILGAVAVYLASLLLHTWRWRLVLASKGSDLGFWTCTRLLVAGNFLNLFLPGNLGGDVYRALGTRGATAGLLQSTGIVVMERYCGFLATFLMALAGVAASDFAAREPELTALVALLFGLFLLPVLLAASGPLTRLLDRTLLRLRLPRAAGLVARIVGAVRSFVRSPGLILALTLLSVAMKVCVVAVFRFLADALRLEVPWHELLVFLPIHTVVSALPISLNGLGVREANLVAFFTSTGLTGEQAASLAFLHLIWVYASALPGGLLLLRRRAGVDRAR